MSSQLLFFYGTLKRGQSANHLLGDSQFIRTAVTEPCYRLLDLGKHRGLVPAEGEGQAIHGELWLVDTKYFPALDAYEGAPTEYGRREIRIQDCDQPVASYFYLGNG
jgi:gamma-glutamylaminecyclotransferase